MEDLPDYSEYEFKVEGSFPIYKITLIGKFQYVDVKAENIQTKTKEEKSISIVQGDKL